MQASKTSAAPASVLAAARQRYPDLSEKLALLLYERDRDTGMIAIEESKAQHDSELAVEPIVGLCAADAQIARAQARPFWDSFESGSTLASYEAIDETHRVLHGPSLWYVKDGALWQSSGIHQQRSFAGQKLARRGSMLLRRDRKFSRFVLTVHFARHLGRPVHSNAVIFCAADVANYYLLLHEVDAGPPPQPLRLLKVCDDVYQVLVETEGPADVSAGVEAEITCVKGHIRVQYGPSRLEVVDSAHRLGAVGLLACANDSLCVDMLHCRAWVPPNLGSGVRAAAQAAFEGDLPAEEVLLADGFTGGGLEGEAEVFDSAGCSFGPSEWLRGGGVLCQRSNIHCTEDYGGGSVMERGGMLVYRRVLECPNVRYRAHVGTADGSMWDGFGFVFHFQDADNYYLLRENRRSMVLRLVRVCAGVWSTLSEVAVPGGRLLSGQAVEVTVQRIWKNNTEYQQSIRARVGNIPSISAVDSTFDGKGRCGFMVFAAPHFAASFLQVVSTVPRDREKHAPAASAGSRACTAPSGGAGKMRLVRMLEEQRQALANAEEQRNELKMLRSGLLFTRKRLQGRRPVAVPSRSAGGEAMG